MHGRWFAVEQEALERTARAYASIFPVVATPSPERVKTLLDEIFAQNPKQRWRPEQFADRGLFRSWKRLDSSNVCTENKIGKKSKSVG